MAERVLTKIDPPPNVLLLFGEGPFEAEELARFLARHGMEATVREKWFVPGETEEDNNEDRWTVSSSVHQPLVIVGRELFQSPGLVSLVLPSTVGDIAMSDTKGSSRLPFTLERLPLDEWNMRLPEHQDEGKILSRKEYGEIFSQSAAELKRWHHAYLAVVSKAHLPKNPEVVFRRSPSLRKMRFLSQEMFLAALLGGQSPEDGFGPTWREHVVQHQGLAWAAIAREEFEKVEYFPWPSTQVMPGRESLEQAEWPKVGMLKYLGYSVGQDGESVPYRRAILSDLFIREKLPQVESPEYVRQWGPPRTAMRLKKMAYAIAAFCKSAKRRGYGSMDIAITEWDEDLDWLKKTYYRGEFDRQFKWPDTK